MTSRRGRGEQQGDSCKDSEQQGAEPLRRESAVEHLARDNEPTVCRGSSTFGVDRELRAASAAPAQRATALRSQRRLMRHVVTRAHITGSAEAKAGVGPPARARGTGASAATRRPRSARSLRRRLAAAPPGRSLPRARLCGGSYPAQSQTRGRYRGEGVGAPPRSGPRASIGCAARRDIVENDAEVLLVSREAASCIGERRIRLGVPPRCRFRRRCSGGWSGSLATSNSGASLSPPRPRCTSTRASRTARQRSRYGHLRHPSRSLAYRCSDPRDRSRAAGPRYSDDGETNRTSLREGKPRATTLG